MPHQGSLPVSPGNACLKRSLDAEIVRQVQLPPIAIVETRLGIGHGSAEDYLSAGGGRVGGERISQRQQPRSGDAVGQIGARFLGITFCESPVCIERLAHAGRLGGHIENRHEQGGRKDGAQQGAHSFHRLLIDWLRILKLRAEGKSPK